MKAPKAKPIDLGTLQTNYEHCKKILATDAKALSGAQDRFDRSKKEFEAAAEALKQGFRAVAS